MTKPRHRLAQAIGQKLNGVRTARGQTVPEMAKQVGVKQDLLEKVLFGDKIPHPVFAERLLGWLVENRSYEKSPRMKTVTRVAKSAGWQKHTFYLPPMLEKRIRKLCKETGYDFRSWIILAVERLVDHEPTILTYKEAMERVNNARLTAQLQENPALQDILTVEDELAVQIGAQVDKLQPVEMGNVVAPYTTHQLANTSVHDGPACDLEEVDFESRHEKLF